MTLRLQFVSSSNQTRFKYDLATALAHGWGGSDCKMNPGATNLPIFDVSHHSNLPSNCTIHGSLWPSKQCVCVFVSSTGKWYCHEMSTIYEEHRATTGACRNAQQWAGFEWLPPTKIPRAYASYAVFSCMEMHTFSTSQHQMVSLLQVVWDLSRC